MSAAAKKLNAVSAGGAIAAALVLGIVVGRFLGQTPEESPESADPRPVAPQAKDAPLTGKERFKLPVSDTQPTLGDPNALVTVTEFCDMRGPACRRANGAMKTLLKEYEGKLRWAFRARVDPAHVEESRRMHTFARDAFQNHGKFWEVHERFLAIADGTRLGDGDFARIAGELGMD
jgi:protein-disulfide isomerase